MAYAIVGVVVVLIVVGFVIFMVLNATRKSSPAADTPREGAPGIGADDTPLGDTTQHAGEQTPEGETADDPERAVEILQELADLAKEVQAEVERARREADASA